MRLAKEMINAWSEVEYCPLRLRIDPDMLGRHWAYRINELVDLIDWIMTRKPGDQVEVASGYMRDVFGKYSLADVATYGRKEFREFFMHMYMQNVHCRMYHPVSAEQELTHVELTRVSKVARRELKRAGKLSKWRCGSPICYHHRLAIWQKASRKTCAHCGSKRAAGGSA